MASVNKVMLLGRLTREPECRTFSNGGKVANFGFAVSNRKKNQQTGQWEEEPMFIDCKVFNRGEMGKKADVAEQYLHKGHQAFLEGHLVFEQWIDKTTGQKRSKHVLHVDEFQFLEPKGSPVTTNNQVIPEMAAVANGPPQEDPGYEDEAAQTIGKDAKDDIPF